MRIITDLHIHSRFAMSTSPRLTLEGIAHAARRKGIDVVAAPDFTHPTWREELRRGLAETDPGSGIYSAHGTNFMLVTEVSCVWRHEGRARRVHLLLTAPHIDAVDRISHALAQVQDLASDGRPTLKLSAIDVLHIVKDADERCQVIPAHAFTPWYGIFGSKTGFDSLDEVFGQDSHLIPAIESGLSADPAMLTGIPDCATRAIVSFSDAHSSENLAREATVLEVADLTYDAIIDAMRQGRIVDTYEFHPAHGKYHLDGHRRCGIRLTPTESRSHRNLCPVCNKPLTLGVLHRTQELAAKSAQSDPETQTSKVQPFRYVVNLREIIAYAFQCNQKNEKVNDIYEAFVSRYGPEIHILVNEPFRMPNRLVTKGRGGIIVGDEIPSAIKAIRNGEVEVEPGYDGVYGHICVNSPPAVRYSSGYGISI